MIQSIQIDNLFGRFNYNISAKLEGITIITGPNGFGKSTILRIVLIGLTQHTTRSSNSSG